MPREPAMRLANNLTYTVFDIAVREYWSWKDGVFSAMPPGAWRPRYLPYLVLDDYQASSTSHSYELALLDTMVLTLTLRINGMSVTSWTYRTRTSAKRAFERWSDYISAMIPTNEEDT